MLAVNTTNNATLYFSPFALLHEYNLKLPCQRHQQCNTETLHERLVRLCDDHIQALHNSEVARETCEKYYNHLHRHVPALKPEDLVWILSSAALS